MANLYTKLVTAVSGKLVGNDQLGNKYYQSRNGSNLEKRRWVIYAAEDDASMVPAEFHSWLHHTSDSFPQQSQLVEAAASWQLEHVGNLTGTPQVWRPDAGYGNGVRPAANSDFIAWRPKER